LRIGRLRIAECGLDGLRMADRESATWCMRHLVNFQSARKFRNPHSAIRIPQC